MLLSVPTEISNPEVNDEFYNLLNATLTKLSIKDINVIMGDLNAQLGNA